MRKFTKSFIADESGQSLLFCALTIFALIVMVGLIAGVGQVTNNQMKLQSAADAAAYSAVAVQADCMAQVALINEGMASIYKECMAEAVNNVLSRTNEVKATPWWNPGDVVVGGAGFFPDVGVAAYGGAVPGNSSWANKGREWYLSLAKIQRLIAVSAPMLIKAQAYQSAHANYYHANSDDEDGKPLRLAMFPAPGSNTNPTWEFYPEEGSYHNAVLEEDPDNVEGWYVYSESDPGFEMRFTHNVIDEDAGNGGTLNEWHVVRTTPEESFEFYVKDTVYSPFISATAPSGKVYGGSMYQEGHYELTINGSNIVVDTYAENAGGEIVMAVIQPSQIESGLTQDVIEKIDGGSIINGKEYKYTDGKFSVDGEEVGGTMTVNGMEVPVNYPSGVSGIRFEWPLHLSLSGLWASFTGGINVHYYFNGAIGWIRGDDEKAIVHTLSTSSPDDRWTWRYGRVGRVQHRLTEYPPVENRFRYEVSNIGTYLEDMPLRKLGVHALMMESSDSPLPSALQNSGYVPLNSLPPRYATEERSSSFKSDDARFIDYESSVWDLFASGGATWACPQRVPRTAADATRTVAFGGFFSLDSGQPYNDYAYSTTLETSPYAQIMQNWGKCYSGVWRLPKYNISGLNLYNYYKNGQTLITGEYNPLWKLYAKVSMGTAEVIEGASDDDADTAANDTTPYIDFDGSNKFNCGFYVLGPYPNWSDTTDIETSKLRSIVIGLGDYYENHLTDKKFYLDAGVSINYPFFAYTINGAMYLAIWDPYGAAAAYANQPRYPNPDMHQYYANDHDAQPIPWSGFKTSLKTAPARVRRYIYHGKDLFGTATNSNDYIDYAMGLDIGSLKFGNEMVKPLQATSQVFRMPVITVAWSPEMSSAVDKLFGKGKGDVGQAQVDAGRYNPLIISDSSDSSKWNSGHFAFSSARVFMRAPADAGGFITNFAYCGGSFDDTSTVAGVQSNAALDFPNEVDQLTQQRMSGNRQRWLESSFNLFEPVWSAALVPLRNSLKLEDVTPESEIVSPDDTAAAFLMRSFYNAAVHNWSNWDGWMKNSYDDFAENSHEDKDASRAWLRMTAPPMQGGGAGNSVQWKGDSGSFDDVVRH